MPGIWHWEKEPLKHFALKASGACVQEFHRTGENRDPILEWHTQVFMCMGSWGKAEAPYETGSDLTTVLGGSPGKTGGHCGLLWGKDIGGKAFGNNHDLFLWRWPFWENLAPPISTEKPQAKQQSRWDQRNTIRLPKAPLGRQAPLISPPTRGIGISPTYQWEGTSASHQEAYSKPS